MTPGILRIPFPDITITATITPDGWQCDNPNALRTLEILAPIPATEAGEPFCIAFHEAVESLHCEIMQEPEADPWPGIGG